MPSDCGSTCPVEGGFYARKSLSVGGNATLLTLFALLTPAVLYMGFRYRTPLFSTILATGLLLEVVGFVGRVLLHGDSTDPIFFLLSLIGTVIGPAFVTGAMISILPHILGVYGEHLSPLQPGLAGIVPGTLQGAAIVIQVVGVIITALDITNLGRTGGSYLLTGGLAAQLAALASFVGVYFLFALGLKTRTVGLDPKHQVVYQSTLFKRFLLGLWTATFFLLIHSLYRTVEVPTGIDGVLFQTEAAFMVVNGALPLLSAILLTALHPGAAFGSAWESTSPTPLRRRRPPPAHVRTSLEYLQDNAHHRYDPSIRKTSPTFQRHTRHSSMADPSTSPGTHSYHKMSPGIQSNPKTSPGFPSSSRTSPGYPPSAKTSPGFPTNAKTSPGLPPNPKAYTKGQSPLPSPTDIPETAGTQERRQSQRPERRINVPKNMVDSESLW